MPPDPASSPMAASRPASDGAARALDELAIEAARVGELRVEASAIFGAAWLYGDAGNGRAAKERIERLGTQAVVTAR